MFANVSSVPKPIEVVLALGIKNLPRAPSEPMQPIPLLLPAEEGGRVSLTLV